ncbi:MAG: hypothetical protein QW228_07820 [Candidatus Aenigmatarchaeota archaeon]
MKIETFYKQNIELFSKNKDFQYMFERGIERILAHWYMPICKVQQTIDNTPTYPKINEEAFLSKILANLEEYMEHVLEIFLPIARKRNPNIDLTYGRLTIAVLYHRLPLEYFLEDLSKTKTYRPLLETSLEAIKLFLNRKENKTESLETTIADTLTEIYKEFKTRRLNLEEINKQKLLKEIKEKNPEEECQKLGLVKKGVFLIEIAEEIEEFLKLKTKNEKPQEPPPSKSYFKPTRER